MLTEIERQTGVCSNCHSSERVEKLPYNLCYSDFHLQAAAIVTHLTLEFYIYHTDCLFADHWRRETGESGFPCFIAVLHERYAPNSVTLKCEACKTHIKHGTRHATPVEDY